MVTSFRLALFASALALASILSLPAHAQSGSSAYSVLPQLGVTSFSLSGSNISGSRAGTYVGAAAALESGTQGLAYESGLFYTQAGAKDDAILASVEYQLDYLAIPLGARYRFGGASASSSHWYARGGLSLAFLMGAKSKAMLLGATAETDVKGQMNSLDALPYLGGGYTWAMGANQSLGAELNYTRGLMDVLKSQASKSAGFIAALNYGFAF